MKKAAIVLGLVGAVVQLGIVSSPGLFEPASPPPAIIVLSVAGLVGAVSSFKKLKIGGIVMLIGGLEYPHHGVDVQPYLRVWLRSISSCHKHVLIGYSPPQNHDPGLVCHLW